MALLRRGRARPEGRVVRRVLAGCLVLGLFAVPGLAWADTTTPTAGQTAPLKAVPKAKAKSKVKPVSAGKRPVKPTGLEAGASMLPVPQPLDAAIPVRRAVKASSKPAATAVQAVAMRIPLPPARPQELARLDPAAPKSGVDEDVQTGSIPVTSPTVLQKALAQPEAPAGKTDIDALISKHAARYNLPESLLRRVVKRESGFNPRLRHGPFVGLMQMRVDTARGVGYSGGADGLLDADTNLTYGAAYLANAWKVAGGSQDRAVRLYTSGYYYEAKRKGLLPHLIKGSPSR
jgi:soluble lytic murein transglycosylase-like protein